MKNGRNIGTARKCLGEFLYQPKTYEQITWSTDICKFYSQAFSRTCNSISTSDAKIVPVNSNIFPVADFMWRFPASKHDCKCDGHKPWSKTGYPQPGLLRPQGPGKTGRVVLKKGSNGDLHLKFPIKVSEQIQQIEARKQKKTATYTSHEILVV